MSRRPTEPHEPPDGAATDVAGGLQAALDLLNAGRLDDAAATAARLRAAAPGDPAVIQLDAAVALRRNEPARALESARASLRRRPGHPPTLLLAARAAWAAGDENTAMAALREAAKTAPDLPEPAFLLCEWQAARDAAPLPAMLAALAARFPRQGAAWLGLGRALLRGGRAGPALAAFDHAISADPAAAAAHMGRGLALREAGRLQEAREALEAALDRDGAAWAAAFQLGLTCQDLGDERAAAEAYAAALAARPDLAEAAVNLGIARQRLGDMDGALAAYREAVRLRPDTFARIAQAATASATGMLWLDLERFRRFLSAPAA
ncbi:MAG: tetratricopeptide repeat protein [Proteobacteria bacterium]|nr:tetratricopeptide repeat protein [Pseudomonadota bacterium]